MPENTEGYNNRQNISEYAEKILEGLLDIPGENQQGGRLTSTPLSQYLVYICWHLTYFVFVL